LILSDVHYACAAERARTNYEVAGINRPLVKLMLRFWRRYLWLADPFAHNYLLDRFLEKCGAADLVVANGDYSCDSAFIGVSDAPSRESAMECLGKLRARFGEKLRAVMGDHELGKSSLAGNAGGLRLESFRVATEQLKIEPAWEQRVGRHVLIGVTSTLIAFDVYQRDALPEELAQWKRLRDEHFEKVREMFAKVDAGDRIILFCHDPTALPFLAADRVIEKKVSQIERTIIGHLHTDLVFWNTRWLAGCPPIRLFGKGVFRISCGLNRARGWRPFRPLLCPSLAGSQLLKDGGYYSLRISDAGADFTRHRLKWEKQTR